MMNWTQTPKEKKSTYKRPKNAKRRKTYAENKENIYYK
jgi:hypothetical protein